MINFKEIVHTAVERGASDIHLTVGIPPIYRIDGTLVDAGDVPLVEEDVAAAAEELADQRQLDTLKQVGEADFAVTFDGEIRMRCNVFYQQGHTAIALRMLPLDIPTMKRKSSISLSEA